MDTRFSRQRDNQPPPLQETPEVFTAPAAEVENGKAVPTEAGAIPRAGGSRRWPGTLVRAVASQDYIGVLAAAVVLTLGIGILHPDFLQPALVPLGGETHGGDDVGVWARGPGASAVRGSVEENTLFHFFVQATPALRGALCAKGYCDANGVPAELPDPAAFRRDALRTASPAPAR